MYTEDDLLPLSALQHVVFCERQCALIHIEQIWDENLFTAEGRIMHERVHERERETRGHVRIERGVPLRSLRLGLIGKADVVEFHRTPSGPWQPFPVEYKRGKPKPDDCDRVQLCAQAMCLEEVLGVEVPCGALYYGKTRHRLDVAFDKTLHEETEKAAWKARELIESGVTPKAVYSKKCERCSLLAQCLPRLSHERRSVSRYMYLARIPLEASPDVLRGIEGDTAHLYFGVFNHLITAQKDDFVFHERNRRPPLDNVNCLLSFVYTLVLHDVRSALETVGLDPAVGFLHRDRPGRPGLALDLMEEFRPFLADRLVLSLINLRKVQKDGFTKADTGAVLMTDETRKEVLVTYQNRKQEEIIHPFIGGKVSIGE